MLKIPPPIEPEPEIIGILRQALVDEFKIGNDERMVALGLMAMLTAFAPIAVLLGTEEATGAIIRILSSLGAKPREEDNSRDDLSENSTRH